MVFRQIRDSIRRVLAQNANGEFSVIGAQKRGKGASEVINRSRLVEVYYARGDFPKTGGSVTGPNKHDMTFRIDLTVASASKGDKATIEDPASTPAQVARAMAAMMESDQSADDSLDELFDRVYQVLMDARHENFDLPVGSLGSRWVSSLNKDEPIERGNYTILTGSCLITCTTSEPVYGLVGVEAGSILDVGVDVETDIPGKAGVQTGA
jgi:hypothetical protein